jgi:hypothetical protein
MSSSNITQDKQFSWSLTQERIDLLAQFLYKTETFLKIAESGGLLVAQVACLLTDLREQCCQYAGATDPFPGMPLAPHFEDLKAPAAEGSAT